MTINDILNLMIEEGYVDREGDIALYSEKRKEDFQTRFEELCKEYKLNCDIDSDHVFDSPGLDIYCYAICVRSIENEYFENCLLTFYLD